MGQVLSSCGTGRTVAIPPSTFGRSESFPLGDGDLGTEQTIDLIRRAVRESLADPVVRSTAAMILRRVPAHNDLAEANAIYQWVLRNIRFTRDPVDFETISDARWTIQNRIGDCDDINAVLLPSLLMVTGHRVRLVTIGNIPNAPDAFSHVYSEVLIRGRWVPLDAARSKARFGVPPKKYFRKRIWSLTENNFQDVAGLAGYPVRLGEIDWTKLFQQGTEAAQRIIAQVKGTPIVLPPVGSVTAQPLPGGGYQVTGGSSSIDTNTLMLLGAAGLGTLLLLRK